MKNERIVLRIKELMQYFQYTQTEMAAKLGIGQSNLSGTLNGKRPCGDGIINKVLISFPDINREWLLYGEGEMLKSATPSVQQNNVHGDNNYNSGVQLLPAFSNVEDMCPQCGGNTVPPAYIKIPDRIIYAPETNVTEWVEDNLDACERIDFLKMLDPRTLKVQRINTRAMEPWISEGAYLFTRYIPEWKRLLFDGTLYGIDLDYPHMIIRRVYDDGENIKCVPINHDYAPITVSRERVLGVYEIVASLKLLKKTL